MAVDTKNIIVSGAARGIGRSLARHLLDIGNRVFLIDVQEEELRYCVKEHLGRFKGRCDYAVCDIRSPTKVRETVAKAAAFFDGKIDVLINNGGIASPHWKNGKTMEDEETLDEWYAYIETNLTAPFVMSQSCVPYMKASSEATLKHIDTPGPCIILIGSFRAHMSDANQEGYASTKSGQLGLMHSMAVSLAKWGIRVNLIAPGRIKVAHESKEGDSRSEEWAKHLEDKDVEQHAANRAGRPDDIAQAAIYLMNAGFVTGQDVNVDGGALKMK